MLNFPWESKTKQRMVFRMIHEKDSLLPMGKVWSAWTSCVLISHSPAWRGGPPSMKGWTSQHEGVDLPAWRGAPPSMKGWTPQHEGVDPLKNKPTNIPGGLPDRGTFHVWQCARNAEANRLNLRCISISTKKRERLGSQCSFWEV